MRAHEYRRTQIATMIKAKNSETKSEQKTKKIQPDDQQRGPNKNGKTNKNTTLEKAHSIG